jgi:hypothetical protein
MFRDLKHARTTPNDAEDNGTNDPPDALIHGSDHGADHETRQEHQPRQPE